MSLPQFMLLRPRTLQEAIGALAKHASNIRVLAGGTDLIPSMRQKLFEPEYVLDIRHLAELRGVQRQPGEGRAPADADEGDDDHFDGMET